jgi:hypothetical protein
MEPHRLRTPKVDGAVLADPPLDRASELIASNSERLGAWDHDFQGRRAGRLRAMARAQALAKAAQHHARFGLDFEMPTDSSAPWIVTGHQPELFHPGVWIKNFAVAALAREHGGVGLNLIVDNDIPKSATIRVPRRGGGHLSARPVEFDGPSAEAPYEDWRVVSEDLFATFADRVRTELGPIVADPVLDSFWPHAMRAAETTDRAGLRFAVARRSVEGGWGVRNLEVPLGSICETEAFAWFACHILADLPRFQATHNAALARYRALYKIRSKNHPVPLLDREGKWIEAPFWAWRDRSPRRRPLMARQLAKTLELRIAGEREPLGALRLTAASEACCAVEDFQDFARRGVRIRTRALTTTMYARLLLGDLFVHGIGGAKYDELGDEVIRGFFGIAAPNYLTLSMTRWLGLGATPEAAATLRSIERRARDLTYNPDLALHDRSEPRIRALVAAKAQAIAGPVATRRQRVDRFRQIRKLNDSLAPFVADLATGLARDRQDQLTTIRDNVIAMNRDWSIVLHSGSGWLRSMHETFPAAFGQKKIGPLPH